jgi:hypothetical protein
MMNRVNSLLSAAALMALALPSMAYAQSKSSMGSQDPTTTNSANGSSTQAAKQEATDMVPARAYLVRKLDAKNDKPGSQFVAKLSDTVHLKNGTELPHGTELLGSVATDELHMQGNSKLALRITEARLKDGKTIPVKATIVGVWGPEGETANGYYAAPGEAEPNNWTSSTLIVDQLNALPGVELHSRIAGNNSGVFVTKKKDDVKLSGGSELALAIAETGSAS